MDAAGKRPGWRWELAPLTFNRARLVHTDGEIVDEFY